MVNDGCPNCGASDKNIKYSTTNIPKIKLAPNNNIIPNGATMIETCRTCGWKSGAVYNKGKWHYEIFNNGNKKIKEFKTKHQDKKRWGK